LLKASVSEVAANTMTVPLTCPLPLELLGAELQAARTDATAMQAPSAPIRTVLRARRASDVPSRITGVRI